MATTLDTLLVRIEADVSNLKRGMEQGTALVNQASTKMEAATNKAAAGFNHLKTAIAAVASVALVSSLARTGKAALDAAGNIGEAADAIGLSTDAYQELTFAAATAGVSQEQFSQSMAIFSRNIGDAAKGNDQLIKTFRDLGINILDTNGRLKGNEQILNEVVDAIAAMPDAARQASVGNDLFGRSFARLLPLFKNGTIGLNELRAEAAKLTREQVDAADKASDSIVKLEAAWFKLQQRLATIIAGPLTWLAENWAGLLSGNFKTESFIDKLSKLNDEIAKLEAIDPRANPRGAAVASQRLAMLRAQREMLLLTSFSPGAAQPPTVESGGSNPRTTSGQKLLDQLEMQRKLAGVTGLYTHEVERQKLAIEARQKAIDAGLTGKDIDHAVALALATFDLAEAQKRSLDMVEAGRDHFNESIQREQEAIQAKEDLLDRVNQEIENNERLIVAIKKGTLAYEQEKALLDLINEAKQKKIDLTPEEIEAYRKLADKIGEQNRELDKQKEKIQDAKKASQDFAHVIGSAFEDAILEGRKLGDVLKALEQDIARIILRVAVTKPLQDSLTDILGGSGESGGGGFLGDIFGSLGGSSEGGGFLSGIGDLFSGGEGGGMFAGMGDWFGGFFAEGGRPPVGKASIVGESGPEFFRPDVAGTIIPGDQMNTGSTYYIDARGADSAGLARVENLIKQLNGTLEPRAVSAVVAARSRNPALFS